MALQEKNTGGRWKKADLGRFTSTQVIAVSFLAAILLGALLLMLPFATAAGEETSFLTALFTSTTSICVTGLVVVDTFSHWTLFGKIIILLLIQIGGFGVLTIFATFLISMKKRISLRERSMIQDYYNQDSGQGMVRFLLQVVKGTFFVEGVGALLYMFSFIPEYGPVKGIWFSIFTSVSAFCNAGIDIFGPNSLIPYQTDLWINLVTMLMIVMGGLGYVVWFDVMLKNRMRKERNLSWKNTLRRLSEHSKLVISLTIVLILSGAALVLLFEYHNPETIGNMSLGDKILASLFQSVTFRTAGFATVPQAGLTDNTCLVGLIYMFIGGSPVGTAGGVKTVTLFMLVLNTVSFIRDRDEAVIFKRKITQKMINKATAVVMVSLTITLICTVALLQTNDVPLVSALYEVFSATGTVGLSRDLTSSLNAAGKLIIIFAMYAGRIGPISMAVFFNGKKSPKNKVGFVEGKFIVG